MDSRERFRLAAKTLLLRNAVASETALAGRATFGFYSGGQQWDAQSWGGSLAFQTAAGSAAENTSQALTVNFLDQWRRRERIRWRCIISPWYPAEVNP